MTGEISFRWLVTLPAAFVAGAVLERACPGRRVPPAWDLGLAVLMVGLAAADFLVLKNEIFLVVAHFLTLLQGVKLVLPKARRDELQIGLIGFFQLLSSFTLSADLTLALFLIAFVPIGTGLLYWHHAAYAEEASRQRPWPQQQLARMHRGILAGALPLTFALTAAVFLLFPRLTFNLQLPGFGASNRSGYTDQIDLGRRGSIEESDAPAVWVRFADDAQRHQWDGYLRGDTLDQFDGRQWRRSDLPNWQRLIADGNGICRVPGPNHGGPAIQAELTSLQPGNNTLFSLGVPRFLVIGLPAVDWHSAGIIRGGGTSNKPLQYRLSANLSRFRDPPDRRHLELRSSPSARVRRLAEQVAGGGSAAEQAAAVEGFLRRSLAYALDYGNGQSPDPVDDFLFESKRGLCGHFASAMAVMMRSRGVPARVVAGFARGDWIEPAGQLLFRQKHAHAWVEVWTGQEWQRFDPTPAAPFSGRAASEWSWQRFRVMAQQYWDYAGYQWTRLVMQYDMTSQLRALERLRSRSDRLAGMLERFRIRWPLPGARVPPEESKRDGGPKHFPWGPAGAGLGLLALILAALVVAARRSTRRGGMQVPARYRRFLRRMAARGMPRLPAETAHEFAQRVSRKLPAFAAEAREATSTYVDARLRRA